MSLWVSTPPTTTVSGCAIVFTPLLVCRCGVARTSRAGGQDSERASCTGASLVTAVRPVCAQQQDHIRSLDGSLNRHQKQSRPIGLGQSEGVRTCPSISSTNHITADHVRWIWGRNPQPLVRGYDCSCFQPSP